MAVQILNVLWNLRDLGLAVHRQSDRSFWTMVVAVESQGNQSSLAHKDATSALKCLKQNLGCREGLPMDKV